MTHHTEAKTIILPTDVDDPNGYGVRWAFRVAVVDRDAMPGFADAIEAEWWRIYRDATAEALEAAGYRVVRVNGSIGSPEVCDAERKYADELYEGDGLPVDMVHVNHLAEDRFSEWLRDNGEALFEQHRPDWSLYVADTGQWLGEATDAQVAASVAAKPDGIILIDADGDVVIDGTWAAQQPGVRKVHVA